MFDGLAERLPFADASADAVVVSLVLCSVADQAAALKVIHRVLDATLWPRVAGGCHTGRDTAAAIEGAGFSIQSLERYLFPETRTPVSFHILGTATRGD